MGETRKQILRSPNISLYATKLKKMELCINLSTFSSTATVTLYALAISAGQAEMFLLPLVILAPASRRIASYKKAMVKLGAYISVFIEQDCFGGGWGFES